MSTVLTIKEAAEYLRVSRSTVWRWCQSGALTSAFKAGRNWRIQRSELEEMMGQSLDQLSTAEEININHTFLKTEREK